MQGNLLVDGILASCYQYLDHDLANIGMLPINSFPVVMESIFGEDSGSSAYSNSADDLGGWVLPSNNFIKLIN